ncbi:class IIb bacteriocin, lactobin A/cerein 7B family [Lactobacillus sp. LL6]|uniref:class IIb bacteriocin, lactobin A/cerein 7B family n=1 Tax=unclassified Lactobacillus TaxID=2620435 RepID=UPI0011862CCC|nr:class IIb bacteriocin, lactobin A/cerein 7B family [Lactobacillus sp. LL6]TSO26888.1 class IIb bacteriocin, lactobin A/cerein 7B family [Lactobacillus sp. LL6]
MNKFETVDVAELSENDLKRVTGGFIPVAVWAIWGGAAAAGFSGGIAVGLNKVNRINDSKKKGK